ncbi:MAG TPA: glycoside hydrolase family 172 protein [Chitinophagaceae bacterium]|nr:glycoside hydrolase family 172 protein [Chitinophagaceae bacterium]
MKRLSNFLLILACGVNNIAAQAIYEMPENSQSGLSSFENLNGVKGNGGKTNKTAKGNAFEWIETKETKTLLDIKGQGVIQRIWLTIDQNPVKLRSLRLQMFWDGETKAAVDVPMGDFFCYNLGKQVAFESALFSSGEGRSFNCYIQMPFRKAARIVLINDGKEKVKLYYDVDYVYQQLPVNALYFHASWTRKWIGELGDDFEILPRVNGKGRFLGMSVGLNTDSSYSKSWWGEGEVKMYIDGDSKYPTINGTGAEDYIGSAWGLGKFINKYQGCTVANDSTRQFNFYRWHVPDAIYFNKDIRVTIQQIGGWGKNEVKELVNKGVKLKPISIDGSAGFVRLLDNPISITDEKFPDGWVNFYRIDDYSAVSYFYLDKPANNLSSLASVDVRVKNVK